MTGKHFTCGWMGDGLFVVKYDNSYVGPEIKFNEFSTKLDICLHLQYIQNLTLDLYVDILMGDTAGGW